MKNKVLLWIIILVILVLVWGLIGGGQAQAIGKTCDMGIGDGQTLCWKWHTNAIGQMQEGLNNILGKT
jgi:hypothetical protein